MSHEPEFTLVKKPNWLIVLEALRLGMPVKLIDRDVYMDEDGNLWCYVISKRLGDPEWDDTKVCINDLEWRTIVMKANSMSEEYINQLVCDMVLNKIKRS